MTSVWDPCLAAKWDGGDNDSIIDSNLCANREILVTKHTFTQTAKGWWSKVSASLDLICEVTRKWEIWAKVGKIFRVLGLIITNGKSWGICWWCMTDFCFCCIDDNACTEASFRHDIKTTLKSVGSKAWKGCIIGILKGRNNCWRSLSFGLETSQVEETTIKTILNSNTIRWLEVTMRYKSYCN